MIRILLVVLLLAALPAHATKEERPMSKTPGPAPAQVTAPAIPTAGYVTFPLQAGKDGTNSGCLWRLPVTNENGLEVYAAVTAVRMPAGMQSALQVAGSVEKDNKKEATVFNDVRLTAGTAFDTETIAVERENGPTARVTFDGAQAMTLLTAVTDHGGTLHYTHDGKKIETALPKPTGDDTAQMWFCLTQLQGTVRKEPTKEQAPEPAKKKSAE